MLNGLDLFSGIGGLTIALAPWVRPVAYCENDRYAQSVLLSRISSGDIPNAPIWDDVQTLEAWMLPDIDIIYGGFPCQDISCAGRGAGLEGERSGLFFEIVRLVDELRPKFVFLENVPAIVNRGLARVVGEFTARGYDCRWQMLSASDVRAPHIRQRWWLLAYAERDVVRNEPRRRESRSSTSEFEHNGAQESLADSASTERERLGAESCGESGGLTDSGSKLSDADSESARRPSVAWRECGDWSIEPDVGRVANGIPARVDRLRGLGNAVVPRCARKAFEILMGL